MTSKKGALADVAVVGGGPAGLAAALTLRKRRDLRVVMFEGASEANIRFGEVLSAGVKPILRYLEVWDKFLAERHLEAPGLYFAWGDGDLRHASFALDGQGTSWVVERSQFDGMLATEAARRGVEIVREANVREIKRTDDGTWALMVGGSHEGLRMARFLIDASGSRSAITRRLGARFESDDQLYAIVGRARGKRIRQSTFVLEATPLGWWYAVNLAEGVVVVAFVTDRIEFAEHLSVSYADSFTRLVKDTVYVREMCSDRFLTVNCRSIPSRFATPAAGVGWALAGDAALCADPISSLGIGFALTSGAGAARVAEAEIKGFESLAESYDSQVRKTFERYSVDRGLRYATESRWPSAGFWVRRRLQSQGSTGEA